MYSENPYRPQSSVAGYSNSIHAQVHGLPAEEPSGSGGGFILAWPTVPLHIILIKADVGNNRRTASTLAHSTVAETARNLVHLPLGFSFDSVRCGATQAPSSQRAVLHESFGSLSSRCAVHNAVKRSNGAPLRALPEFHI